ncbi:DUF2891 family protein [Kribbella sandramycini]|uniref:DUF2891 family protein n=1 Tax=Kribbella sandramycini TaxID=60450 RepID=A0A7Y4L702_9ACTN|nr:DUF2891 family protein [Kribbella sandramycini]MBB6566747.1 hypothetical protein [Kribbella sandramycini]NOL45533.1 DUF2891 family protein [Kribbella sandramycini]
MEYAASWSAIACEVLETPYPYGAAHASKGPDDVDVTPERLHPAFHGSYDWHSSAHMQWSLVRLLTLAPDQVGPRPLELLNERLTPEAIATEAAYLRDRPSYERPYGWAWAAMLVAAGHDRWPLKPLGDVIADLVLDWLPRQAYPVRHGAHLNSAFALSLLIEAYAELGRSDVVDAVRARALDWFGRDSAYDTRFEPSGTDFLSPALSEAELMRRVLSPEQFADWLPAFLPGLGSTNHQHLLELPVTDDSGDGQLAHLSGLALSRAWQLRTLAPSLPDVADILRAGADRQIEPVLPTVTEGDFMSTHWLVSFALLAHQA